VVVQVTQGRVEINGRIAHERPEVSVRMWSEEILQGFHDTTVGMETSVGKMSVIDVDNVAVSWS